MIYNEKSKLLKISDVNWIFKILPEFKKDHIFYNKFFIDHNNDAFEMYGLKYKSKQLSDGFYSFEVIDPSLWMLTILKYGFEIN